MIFWPVLAFLSLTLDFLFAELVNCVYYENKVLEETINLHKSRRLQYWLSVIDFSRKH